jgi:hypothetical protein
VGGVLATQALRDAPGAGTGLALAGPAGIEGALETLRSGERGAAGDGEVEIIASFLTPEGEFCREFEFDGAEARRLVSVACRHAEGWETRFAVQTPARDDATYAPAASLQTLDAYLAAIGAGPPLAPEEEAARLAQGR